MLRICPRVTVIRETMNWAFVIDTTCISVYLRRRYLPIQSSSQPGNETALASGAITSNNKTIPGSMMSIFAIAHRRHLRKHMGNQTSGHGRVFFPRYVLHHLPSKPNRPACNPYPSWVFDSEKICSRLLEITLSEPPKGCNILFFDSLFFLLVRVARKLRSLRFHPPRLCRFAVS